jgi:signal transduction histidine kinase
LSATFVAYLPGSIANFRHTQHGGGGVAEQLWRAVATFRVASLAYAAALVIANHDRYARPALGWVLLGVMAAWTVAVVALRPRAAADDGRRPAGIQPWLLGVDVVVAAGMVLATLAVESAPRIEQGAPTLPAAWAAGAVLACAVAGGWRGGGLAAAAVSAADVVERGALTEHTFNGVVLLLFAGLVGGYLVDLALGAERAVVTASRREAAVAERERLARQIHDSVLQVLALVSRRGAAAGGELADLARLAGEQEVALRALVAAPPAEPDALGQIDLRSLLEPLAADRVSVSCPAQPVMLTASVATELAAASREALANVTRHAGPAARAWLLVEDEGEAVAVTVRDDGIGFDPERLTEARRNGRLGVAQSIIGRMSDIGGTAAVDSAPGRGTEVELRVRRP